MNPTEYLKQWQSENDVVFGDALFRLITELMFHYHKHLVYVDSLAANARPRKNKIPLQIQKAAKKICAEWTQTAFVYEKKSTGAIAVDPWNHYQRLKSAEIIDIAHFSEWEFPQWTVTNDRWEL